MRPQLCPLRCPPYPLRCPPYPGSTATTDHGWLGSPFTPTLSSIHVHLQALLAQSQATQNAANNQLAMERHQREAAAADKAALALQVGQLEAKLGRPRCTCSPLVYASGGPTRSEARGGARAGGAAGRSGGGLHPRPEAPRRPPGRLRRRRRRRQWRADGPVPRQRREPHEGGYRPVRSLRREMKCSLARQQTLFPPPFAPLAPTFFRCWLLAAAGCCLAFCFKGLWTRQRRTLWTRCTRTWRRGAAT